MYKLVLSDLDETLLVNHHVPKINQDMIQKARDRGIQFVPCTGRGYDMTIDTLKELGITEVTDEKLMAVATAACAENDTLHNMPFEVTPETVCAAIKAADAYGKYFLGE